MFPAPRPSRTQVLPSCCSTSGTSARQSASPVSCSTSVASRTTTAPRLRGAAGSAESIPTESCCGLVVQRFQTSEPPAADDAEIFGDLTACVIQSSAMPPADRNRKLREGHVHDDLDPLPGFNAPRGRKLAAGWDDGGLWDDVAWLGEYFWAATDPADRAVRWHHVVLAVGNFKRPRARWLCPCRLEGIGRQQPNVATSFETPAGLHVYRDDRASWESLRSSLAGADVSTTVALLAALWPSHHFVFDWRVRAAASGLRLAANLEPCPGVKPSIAGGESSPLDFEDYILVRGWLQAVGAPLGVSQRALFCLSKKAGSDPSRPWSEYSRVLVSILESVDDATAAPADCHGR
jgi:hypothetical protein